MESKKEPSDPRLNVARYQVDGSTPSDDADTESDAGQSMMEARAHYVELSIQQAMRRGDFDNLPGAGKPIEGLDRAYDPDWWIRKKIERERITGLGPPALTLRGENAALDDRLDAMYSEQKVRETLDDFNRRIVNARRQLQRGPPVVTPVRDVEAEVARWRQRAAERRRELDEVREREAAALAALTPRERRRARRNQ